MDIYFPFVHYLKDIVINYRRSNIPQVQDDVRTCDGPESKAQSSIENVDKRSEVKVKTSINSKKQKKPFSTVTCCGYTFDHPNLYKEHLKSESHSSWKCHICKGIFNSKESYAVHRKEKHFDHDGKWICQICNAEYTSKGILTRHIHSVHDKAELFQCEKCSFATTRKENLTRHIKCKHAEDYDHPCCHICGRKFETKHMLSCHIKKIHDQKCLQCDICSSKFGDIKLLDYHKRTHFPEQHCLQNTVALPQVQDDVGTCGGPESKAQSSIEIIDGRNEVRVKTSIDSQEQKKPFSPVNCCGYTFKHLCYYNRHLKSQSHSSSWKCRLCKEIFNSKESYDVHRKEKHFDHDGKWICQICNAEFTTNGILSRHISSQHDKTLFQCDICSFASTRKENLIRHIKVKHLRDYDDHCCHICGRKFVTKSMLSCHIKNIHDKKRLQCDICSRSFNDIEFLEFHKRTHFPEQHFACQVCGKMFRTFLRRERHFKTHMKAKPTKKKTEKSKRQRQASSGSSKLFDCSENSVSDSVLDKVSDSNTSHYRDMRNNLKSENSEDEENEFSSRSDDDETVPQLPLREDLLSEEVNDTNKLLKVRLCQPQSSFVGNNSSCEKKLSKNTGDEPRDESCLLPSDEIEGDIKSDTDNTVLYSHIHENLKTQTGNTNTEGVSVSVKDEKYSEVERLPNLENKASLNRNCIPQHQTTSEEEDQLLISPSEFDSPDDGSWLTEIINGNNTHKRVVRNRNMASIPRKARERPVKPVVQDLTSKLRRRIKNIFQEDGPKVFIKHLVDDDSDVFLLPEFFTEDDYENLAPGVENIQDTVVMDAELPVMSLDEYHLSKSITALNTEIGEI